MGKPGVGTDSGGGCCLLLSDADFCNVDEPEEIDGVALVDVLKNCESVESEGLSDAEADSLIFVPFSCGLGTALMRGLGAGLLRML